MSVSELMMLIWGSIVDACNERKTDVLALKADSDHDKGEMEVSMTLHDGRVRRIKITVEVI